MQEAAAAAFAAFRRTGDPGALAVVFDATAPELLRVAAFLVPRADVEDLVHDTFVAALARAGAYDPARPLLPWLLGVLANEARSARRRARRRERDRAARVPAATPDPAAAASAREVTAAFAAALQQLDRDDARLLQQHLVEERSCREIAVRERRPAGTVRTQVARAMAELRRRLPVGLAVAPGFGDIAPAALARVRARLLAAMPAAGVAGVWWPRLGWWCLGVAVAAAVAIAVWVAGTAPASVPASVAAAEGSAAPERGSSGAAPDRPSPAVERAAIADAGPAPWTLRGHVRTATGEPLVGARVVCCRAEAGPVLAVAASGADGGYVLDLGYWRDRPQLDRAGYRLLARAAAPCGEAAWFEAPLPQPATEAEPVAIVHDFVVETGRLLRGRALDLERQPVPALVLAHGGMANSADVLLASGEAVADGYFALRLGASVQGPLRLTLRHATAGVLRRDVVVPADQDVDLGDLVLQPGVPISGSVVLLDGTPVPCDLFVRGGLSHDAEGWPQPTADYWYFHTPNGADGRFRGSRLASGPWSVRVEGPLGFGHQPVEDAIEVAGDQHHVDLGLDGVVLDLAWIDPQGRALLPHATRAVVFAPADRAAAEAARAGDTTALDRALADAWLRGPQLVVPSGSHVWLEGRIGDAHGFDELVTVPVRNGRIPVVLHCAAAAATELVVRVRFADGAVPADFTCTVAPQPGASRRGFTELARGPGEVRGLGPVGPLLVRLCAYPATVAGTPLFDGAAEEHSLHAVAERRNELDLVLARRGPIRFELRDLAAPQRVAADGEDPLDGEITVDGVRVRRLWWPADPVEHSTWGGPWLGRPAASRLLVPVGRREVRFEIAGYEPETRWFDVTEAGGDVLVVWLRPR
ncbi:MAG: sigma-70 family RNA polymerase sigma factor [Planctomycetes bacterium]|nr:sigma-70 family RNA polymerase sigma factor [Planctomycetota bacterium]